LHRAIQWYGHCKARGPVRALDVTLLPETVRERSVGVTAPPRATEFFAAGSGALRTAYHDEGMPNELGLVEPQRWVELEADIVEPFLFATRPLCNAELLAFVHDDGYLDPRLWIPEGFATAQREHWRAPQYWERLDGIWVTCDVVGPREIDPAAVACYLSYYEADAIARWAHARLPTEAEWELAAAASSLPATRARTFFAPSARRQLTGVRLAADRGAP